MTADLILSLRKLHKDFPDDNGLAGEAADEIERLMGKWRSIRSAYKERRWILGWVPSSDGYQKRQKGCGLIYVMIRSRDAAHNSGKPFWSTGGWVKGTRRKIKPTHWMPLPPRPIDAP